MLQLPEYQILIERLQEPLPRIQAITGPRQVGKTTLVRQVLEALPYPSRYASADDQSLAGIAWIRQCWQEARLLSREKQTPVALALDELQKIHGWSDTVKALFDEDRHTGTTVHAVVLGSSRLLLQQGLGESLAGRFELITLTHWRYTWMKEAFGFSPEQYVWFGAYPGMVEYLNDEERWKAYIRNALVETAINRDILLMTRVEKPALLRRLFELGCSYSGQILSYTKMLGQLQDAGNTVTLSHYLDLLDQAGLLSGLEKFAGDDARKRSSSPRFQVLNPALANSRLPQSFSEVQANHALWGRVVESGIGAWLQTFRKDGIETLYWKQGDLEVDFILRWQGKTIALEIKTGYEDSPGLAAFSKHYPGVPVYLIGPSGIPWQELLEKDVRMMF